MSRNSAEYVRGRDAGFQVACAALKTHGRERVEADSRELRTDARKRGSDEFDRGYALGYMDALRNEAVAKMLED